MIVRALIIGAQFMEFKALVVENADKKAGAEFISDAARGECAEMELGAERYDLRVLQSLRRVIRAIDMYSRKLLSVHKITNPQLICLQEIATHKKITTGRLAKEVHLSASTVIGILDRLQGKGLVYRERDLKDRRKVFVMLTDEGRKLLNNTPSLLQDTLASAMNDLPAIEQRAIAESLDKVIEMMEVTHIEASPILETGAIEPSVKTDSR